MTTKLDPAMINQLVALIEGGNYKKHAAEIAGISERTLHLWLAKGRAEANQPTDPIDPNDYTKKQLQTMCDDRGLAYALNNTKQQLADTINDSHEPSLYLQLFQSLTQARAKAIAYAIQEMQRVGRDDWRMWMEYLARTEPELFGRNRGDGTFDPEYAAGDADDAEDILERATTIRIKMLEAPPPETRLA